MKLTLKLEELFMLLGAVYGISMYDLGISIWVWTLLFFAPDAGMAGYMLNTKAGAFTYNICHHKGLASLLAAAGFMWHIDWLIATGFLLLAHSSFDRLLGYGLKYEDGFTNTHLGRIGK